MADYVLSGGTEVTIRAIRPDDGERLRAAHVRLSEESRYRRFLAAKPQLSHADARYLVELDGSDHFALVATVPDDADSDQIIAVARYVRDEDPAAAEFAIVIGDPYQRQGLGRELMARLAQAAAQRGIARFRATTLSPNVAVLRLMEKLADGPLRSTRHGSVSEVEIGLAAARQVGLIPFPMPEADGPGPAIIAGCAGS